MMKRFNYLLLTLALCLISNLIFAHALWIETAENGKIGVQQTVKIYYGEYIAGERDSVSKWYSDVKDFTLWLTGPDLKKVKLKLTPGTNYYETNFTPSVNGTYVLTASHEAKDLGGTTKYHFLSSANVVIGNSSTAELQPINALQLTKEQGTSKVNQQITLKSFLNNSPAAGKTVTVFSPSGWSREIVTDAKGNIGFVPLWPGQYVIEVTDTDKTPGEHFGKAYKSTWKGATYSIVVSK
jgi:hypothetical protein